MIRDESCCAETAVFDVETLTITNTLDGEYLVLVNYD